MNDEVYWLLVDGDKGRPFINVIATADYDLAQFYRDKGHEVVEALRGPGLRWPLCLTTCVGMVKAVLGIRSWALTPRQLYKHLRSL